MSVPTISTEELRELLDRGAGGGVTVLDVRPAAERAEWSIPGSLHVDAYDALRRGDPHALEGFQPSNGGRVVTVCGAGKTSRLAVEQLRARGFDPQQAANLALPAKLAGLFSEREQLRSELETIKRKNRAN